MKYMSSAFHVAPDGKLYFTDVHNLKAFNGTSEFCIEYTSGGEQRLESKDGIPKYPDHGEMSELDGKCTAFHKY